MIPQIPSRLDLTHIRRLTNHIGIIQHARYHVPDYRHGYCLDDNSRALLLLSTAQPLRFGEEATELMVTYLAYIQYMQTENGKFRNFLSFDHRFLDHEGTADSYGRTLWTLGALGAIPLASELFIKALPHCLALDSVRAIAYSLLGIIRRYEAGGEPELMGHVHRLTERLVNEYRLCTKNSVGWHWFEEIISYDNAIIPYSLFRAGSILDQAGIKMSWQEIAWESTFFLDKLLFEQDFLSTIGNSAWYQRHGARSVFGQQPIEVPSLILLYQQLFSVSGDEHYQQRAEQAFAWFFGENEKSLPLYDPVTKGCRDGLENYGVNQNQGAESTISFWMAYLLLVNNASKSASSDTVA